MNNKKLFSSEDFDKEARVSENLETDPKTSETTGNEPKATDRKTKPWLWIAVAAIVVTAGVIGFMQMNPSSGNEDGGDSVTATVDTKTTEKTDTASASTSEDAVSGADTSVEVMDNVAVPESTKENDATAQSQNAVSVTMPAPQSQSTGSVEDEARQVIRGIYGNGSVRKQKLGNRYSEIQSKVNEMYRTGQVR